MMKAGNAWCDRLVPLAAVLPLLSPTVTAQVTCMAGNTDVTFTQVHDATAKTVTYKMKNNNTKQQPAACFIIEQIPFARSRLNGAATATNSFDRVATVQNVAAAICCAGPNNGTSACNQCNQLICPFTLTKPATFEAAANASSELSTDDGLYHLTFTSSVSGTPGNLMATYQVVNAGSSPVQRAWAGTPINGQVVSGGGGTFIASATGDVVSLQVRTVDADQSMLRGLATTHVLSGGGDIPTMTGWGLTAMVAVLLAAGCAVLVRQNKSRNIRVSH
jgi:hypothetical protein